jgi:alkanesulfonate monooxygenase SsuD/methylene tetrahydromethanopterin reductase-like flavin-dependent oxidoreductase (luciferase family)
MREEFEVLGIPWERRGARTDEYIAAMRALWAGPHAEFHGEFVDFPPATCSPRPEAGSIPILVGGDTSAAVTRAARSGNGYFPGTNDPEALAARIAELREAAKRHDRAPEEIPVHAIFGAQMADPEAGSMQLAELGVHRAMLPAFFFMGPGGLERLAEFGDKIVKPLA